MGLGWTLALQRLLRAHFAQSLLLHQREGGLEGGLHAVVVGGGEELGQER